MEIDIMKTYIEPIIIWGITAFMAFLCGLIWNNYKREKEIEKNLKLGVLALLKSEIVKEHAKCMEAGFCSVCSIQLVDAIYKSYHELGGNGIATRLVDDIKELPTKLPK